MGGLNFGSSAPFLCVNRTPKEVSMQLGPVVIALGSVELLH